MSPRRQAPRRLTKRLAADARTPSMPTAVLADVGLEDSGGSRSGRVPGGRGHRACSAALPDATTIGARQGAPLLVGVANSSAAGVSPGGSTGNRVGATLSPGASPLGLPGGIATRGGGGPISPGRLRATRAGSQQRPSAQGIARGRSGLRGADAADRRIDRDRRQARIVPGPVPRAARGAAAAGARGVETPFSRAMTDSVKHLRAVRRRDVANAFRLLVEPGSSHFRPRRSDPQLTLTRGDAAIGAGRPSPRTRAPAATATGSPDWFDDLRIAPIMKAPRFDRPMYEALDATTAIG